MRKLKIKANPRGRIRDWRDSLRKIEKLRKKVSIEVACVEVGVAFSTYYEWRNRLAAEKKLKA
jgi:hypothetical protein